MPLVTAVPSPKDNQQFKQGLRWLYGAPKPIQNVLNVGADSAKLKTAEP
jgi:hypothetical protein